MYMEGGGGEGVHFPFYFLKVTFYPRDGESGLSAGSGMFPVWWSSCCYLVRCRENVLRLARWFSSVRGGLKHVKQSSSLPRPCSVCVVEDSVLRGVRCAYTVPIHRQRQRMVLSYIISVQALKQKSGTLKTTRS